MHALAALAIFMPCLLLAADGILFQAIQKSEKKTEHVWSYTKSLEFHQIYNYGAVGDKDKLIRFRGQKVKGHNETKCTFPVNDVCRWRLPSLLYIYAYYTVKC